MKHKQRIKNVTSQDFLRTLWVVAESFENSGKPDFPEEVFLVSRGQAQRFHGKRMAQLLNPISISSHHV